MRRLVVISGKSKLIATLAAMAFSLTSIHLAAKAHIASLQREQEQLEKTAFSTQQSALSQNGSLNTLKPIPSAPLAPNSGAVTEPSANAPSVAKTSVTADHGISPASRRQIIISIADRQLAVIDHGQVLKTYPIAVGARGTPSPDGDFVVINHAKDPVYRHGETEIAPGEDNPLGTRWMGLSLKGYGIHGTNVQSSVGKAISHGCFRMRKQDVEELYTLVQVGDTVMVRRERDAMIAKVFATPTATHPDVTLAAATTTTVETTEQ
ncbi:MAG TPA: L,D-transpeptidase [Candidatus Angelobacter sp.]|jgi:lipoprotein-anchoring transpeptidase ErfK/SrfK